MLLFLICLICEAVLAWIVLFLLMVRVICWNHWITGILVVIKRLVLFEWLRMHGMSRLLPRVVRILHACRPGFGIYSSSILPRLLIIAILIGLLFHLSVHQLLPHPFNIVDVLVQVPSVGRIDCRLPRRHFELLSCHLELLFWHHGWLLRP